MMRLIPVFAALLLAGCGGTGSPTASFKNPNPDAPDPVNVEDIVFLDVADIPPRPCPEGPVPCDAIRFGTWDNEPFAWGPENTVPFPTGQGSAVWSGRLVGLTPALDEVRGRAVLTLELDTLAGSLRFDELTWEAGNLDYSVAVAGAGFSRTGGDAGEIDGRFYGVHRGGMGGTLKREDLAAGFGGRR